eukprot:SAG11_NODE_15616_length_571_cov_13.603814_1_plen_82_part_10
MCERKTHLHKQSTPTRPKQNVQAVLDHPLQPNGRTGGSHVRARVSAASTGQRGEHGPAWRARASAASTGQRGERGERGLARA